MTTRTISIGDKAYKHLKRLKREKESFTDVILRLAGRGDLTRYAGTISADFARDLTRGSTEVRARFDAERKRGVS